MRFKAFRIVFIIATFFLLESCRSSNPIMHDNNCLDSVIKNPESENVYHTNCNRSAEDFCKEIGSKVFMKVVDSRRNALARIQFSCVNEKNTQDISKNNSEMDKNFDVRQTPERLKEHSRKIKNLLKTTKDEPYIDNDFESAIIECKELGFKKGTEKFGECVLKLSE